jgi:aminoglycoside 6'-N-acetyltransferase I
MIERTSLIIEKISEKHFGSVAEMALKLWPQCSLEEEIDNCSKIARSPDENIFVARIGDQYVGFIQLSLRSDYVEGTTSSPVVYVEGLYVEPPYRKQRIASHLVIRAEAWGIEKNCTEIASDTELINTDSIEFHKSIGFHEANRIVCFSKVIKDPN